MSVCTLSLLLVAACELQGSPSRKEVRTAECIVDRLRTVPGVEPQELAPIIRTAEGLEVTYSVLTNRGDRRLGKSATLRSAGEETKVVVFYLYDDAADVYDCP